MGLLDGWTTKLLADGLALYPPGGKEAGAIRIRERVRPLASVARIIAPDVERMKGMLDAIEVCPLERFFTAQGEYAALVAIQGTAAGRPGHRVEQTIAIVFGDDFYQRFDGIAQDEEQLASMRARIRGLAHEASLGLGELRWRRFQYTPPQGWQPLARALTTEWFPTDYPGRYARIAIPPAYASQEPSVVNKHVLQRTVPGFLPDTEVAPQPVSTKIGLSGYFFHYPGSTPDGRRLVYDHVLLHETRYSYLMFLETEQALWPEMHEVFKAVAESIEPLRVGDPSEQAMVHWVE